MTLLKNIFAAHCPRCNAKLRYTGWLLLYPKYICEHCVNVDEMNMDMFIVHKEMIALREQEKEILQNFVQRRRERQKEVTPKKAILSAFNSGELYICRNFTTRSATCDRCRCNIWHESDRVEQFKDYRNCYEPTVFEIKPLVI